MSPVLMLMLSLGAALAHQGHLQSAPWDACAEPAERGQACRFEDAAHAVYRGTCQPMSGSMVCVRNQPIERPQAPRRSVGLPWILGGVAVLGGLGMTPIVRRRRPARSAR